MLRWLLAGLALVALAGVALLASGGDDAGEPPTPAPRATAAPPPATPAAVARAITAGGLTEHLGALQRIADENGGNRAAGTPGERATAAFLERRLEAAGYRVATRPLDIPYFEEESPPRLTAGSDRIEDVRTLQLSGAGTATGAVRRAGLGCAAGDFSALREDEIALVQRGTCTFESKARRAAQAGAAAVLVADEDEPVAGSLERPAPIPVLAVSDATAAELEGATATVTVDAVSETRSSTSVVAEAGGRDADRVVMAGAHLDSVPAGPGLNDNGSGVAAVLEVAEALGGRRLPDGVAVRFGFWGAEEIGLLGSRDYVGDLGAAERRRIAAYVNLDMVGSPDSEPAVYDGAQAIESALRRALPGDEDERSLGGASDHAPFDEAGIPVGGIFTGLDDCYHERCDTLGNVDRDVLLTSARAAGAAIVELAGR